MKNLFLAILVILLLASVMRINDSRKQDKIDLEQLVSRCKITTSDPSDCYPEKINDIVVKQTAATHKGLNRIVIQNTEGAFIDMNTGAITFPDLRGISDIQKNIWESWRNEKKLNSKGGFTMSNNFTEIIVVLAVVLVFGILALLIIPIAWRFFLNRLSEISKAVKGEKF